jgi:hypothetical protein
MNLGWLITWSYLMCLCIYSTGYLALEAIWEHGSTSEDLDKLSSYQMIENQIKINPLCLRAKNERDTKLALREAFSRQGWARPASAGQGVGARRCCRGLHVGGSGHGRAQARVAAQGGRRCCRGRCGWWRRSCRGRPAAAVDGFGRPQCCRPRSPPRQKLLSLHWAWTAMHCNACSR